MMNDVFWYRFDSHSSCAADEWGDLIPSSRTIHVTFHKARVVKVTPCGVRLDNGRFINRNWTKKAYCETIEEAKVSFIARKTRLISIAQHRIRDAEEAIRLIEKRSLTE